MAKQTERNSARDDVLKSRAERAKDLNEPVKTREELEAMNEKQLAEYARKWGINLLGRDNKKDKIDLIVDETLPPPPESNTDSEAEARRTAAASTPVSNAAGGTSGPAVDRPVGESEEAERQRAQRMQEDANRRQGTFGKRFDTSKPVRAADYGNAPTDALGNRLDRQDPRKLPEVDGSGEQLAKPETRVVDETQNNERINELTEENKQLRGEIENLQAVLEATQDELAELQQKYKEDVKPTGAEPGTTGMEEPAADNKLRNDEGKQKE